MKSLVHVLTVSDSLLFLRGQPDFMRQHGLDTAVITSRGEGLEAFELDNDVRVRAVEMLRQISPLRDLVSLTRVMRAMASFEADIVHAHTPKGGLLGIIAGTALRVPKRVYHLRGLPLETASGWRRALLWMAERTSCGLATDVIAVSDSLLGRAIELRLVSREKSRVIGRGSGQGVDAEHFAPDEERRAAARLALGYRSDEIVFVFVGRLVADKGIRELTDAWKAVRAQSAHARLLVVGPREQRDAVPAGVLDALERDGRVQLTGYLSDVRQAYAASDVLVLPSRREGFPNAPLEAASMSLPVVTTNATGCIDSIENGVTGIAVDVQSPEQLASAMMRYANELELRCRHGEAGRSRVLRDFRPEDLWRGILDVYETS